MCVNSEAGQSTLYTDIEVCLKNKVHPRHNRMAALHIGYGLPVLYDHK